MKAAESVTAAPPRRLVGSLGDEGVRCPVCDYVIATVRPVAGSRLTVRCPNRRCTVWVVVIVPAPVDESVSPG